MTAWLSVLVPLLVMFFALGMERVESRLRESTVRQDELDELLEQPRPDEVRALFRSGTSRALELFRLRHRDAPGRGPARRSAPRRNKIDFRRGPVRDTPVRDASARDTPVTSPGSVGRP